MHNEGLCIVVPLSPRCTNTDKRLSMDCVRAGSRSVGAAAPRAPDSRSSVSGTDRES